ncbi:hypothetical protein NOR_03808 [Metarhizium rileyi]|uniref:Uncharacterized protein n=1 Tax=Metarhizium rileyi (strain RCEF 4871) TaxID=1649241 RepID=A0A167FBX2_METRR|nr:hypothetical protein NOR_03808 [Metarhizium rileyi RCEF 4871]
MSEFLRVTRSSAANPPAPKEPNYDPAATEQDGETSGGEEETQGMSQTARPPEPEAEDEEMALDRSIAKLLRVHQKKQQLADLRKALDFVPIPSPPSVPAVLGNSSTNSDVAAYYPRYSMVIAQLKAPSYKGETYESLLSFLLDLNVAFFLDRHNFMDDASKVAYASSCLVEDAKRQWIRHAADDGYIDYSKHTWLGFVKWLKDETIDEDASY